MKRKVAVGEKLQSTSKQKKKRIDDQAPLEDGKRLNKENVADQSSNVVADEDVPVDKENAPDQMNLPGPNLSAKKKKKTIGKAKAPARQSQKEQSEESLPSETVPVPSTGAYDAEGTEVIPGSVLNQEWFMALKAQFDEPYWQDLKAFLQSENSKSIKIYPSANQIFSAFSLCSLKGLKVVILGQDPYINEGQAHGLCFSVPRGQPPPPSLLNMYKELETDIKGFVRPKHGCLEEWASQGVLLLNSCMTVQAGKSFSHAKKGWETFTDAVIALINVRCEKVVFLLWGKPAQEKGKKIDQERHCVITTAHPSPLSASRGFFKSKCFSQANKYLLDNDKEAINWKLTP